MHMKKNLMVSFLFAAAVATGQELTIEPNFGNDYVPHNHALQLKLSRPIGSEEGKVVVFIDQTDVTQLIRVSPSLISYGPNALPLPAGQHEVIVSLVRSDDTWSELGRFPVKVLTRRGFESAAIRPSLDLSNKGQVGLHEIPENAFGTRSTFQDVTLQGGMATELQRGGFALRTQANIAGASYINEALRYGNLGDRAPRVDLSSYRIDWQQGRALVSLGHVSFGSHRHLIQNFGGRGGLFSLTLSRALSVQLAALSGTAIVGWDDIVGIENQEHRMYAATLGVEMIPARPGGLRFEASLLDGSLRPVSSFNQGAIRSAEKSRGHALRLAASTPRQRFTIDTGYTRSRFRPARDEELEGGLDVVPLQERERNAAYVEAALTLLQGKPITKTQQANLSITYRFDRVDPLFRSVAVSTQADLQRHAAGLNATVGPFALQVGHERMQDNLEDIRSILKTKTEQTTANVGLSLGSVVKRRYAWAVPAITASYSFTHQFGAYLPVNSGFSESHVPDQASSNLQTAIQWMAGYSRFGYRWNFTRQDNRQPGRQTSDFETTAGGIYFGLSPNDRFDVSLESSLEQQENIEIARRDQNQRHGITLTWRFFRDLAVAGNLSKSIARDDPRTNERDGHEGFLELSSGFRLWAARPGQQQNRNRVFIRYSNRESSSFDRIFAVSNASEGYSVTTGVNLSVF
jgi:hypothetical protein